MKTPVTLRQCQTCERLFYAPRRSRGKYCSPECRKARETIQKRKYSRRYPKKLLQTFLEQYYPEVLKEYRNVFLQMRVCPVCNRKFLKKPKTRQKYCSWKCQKAGYRDKVKQWYLRKRRWLAYQGTYQELGDIKLKIALRRMEHERH